MAIIRELNLLPPERRHYLSRQLSLNALVALCRSLIWALVIVTVGGVVAAGILQGLAAFLTTSTTAMLDVRAARYQELRSQIIKENETIKFMATTSQDRVVWSDLFADLVSTMPPGTHITRIGGDIQPEEKLSFSGQAVSRSALVVLEDRLKHLAWVKSVNAPNSNLLQRTNPVYAFDVLLVGDEKPKEGSP